MASERTVNRRSIVRQARRREREQGPARAVPHYERPRTYGECSGLPRPCPFLGCKYHLALDVKPGGTLVFPFGVESDLTEARDTCALDVASRGPHSLAAVGAIIGVNRERVRQIEERAIMRLEAATDRRSLLELGAPQPETMMAGVRHLSAGGPARAIGESVCRSGPVREWTRHEIARFINGDAGTAGAMPAPAPAPVAVAVAVQATPIPIPPLGETDVSRAAIAQQKREYAAERLRAGALGAAVEAEIKERFGSGIGATAIVKIRRQLGGAPMQERAAIAQPAVAPERTYLPAPERPSSPTPATNDLRHCLARLVDAMRAHAVSRVSVTADGQVRMEREEAFNL